MKKLLIFILTLGIIGLSACSKTTSYSEEYSELTAAHVCEHVCPYCGYCLDESCQDPACSMKCSGHIILSKEYIGEVEGVSFNLPSLGSAVSIHTDIQKEYLEYKHYAQAYKFVDGTSELSFPNPVTFTFKTSLSADSYIIRISETEDFSDYLEYETKVKELEVYNLKIGTTYYWNVTVNDITSGTAVFTTENNGPRNLKIDGITNARDIGGWPTSTGKTFLQGMVYRSTRLTENYLTTALITKDGIDTERNVLKIKSEIDLRGSVNTLGVSENGGITSSILGDDVNYYYYPMSYSNTMYLDNKAMIAALFNEVLSNEDNYPVTIHCSAGADRCGMVCFLIGALCGTNEISLYKDYLFTNFYKSGSYRELTSILNDYVKPIKTFDGDTFQEKTYNCLKDLGVTEENLNKIISILTK